MRVRDVMSSPAVVTAPETPVKSVAARLTEHHFTGVPVVADGDLVGVVTEADLLAGRFPPDSRVARTGGWDPDLGERVGDVTRTDVPVARPAEAVSELLARLRAANSRMAPVVERGVVIGVVTYQDLVRALARDDVLIAADVRRRIGVYAGVGRWEVLVSSGEVMLTGEERAVAERGVLERIAESVIGVTAVRFAAPARTGATS